METNLVKLVIAVEAAWIIKLETKSLPPTKPIISHIWKNMIVLLMGEIVDLYDSQ